MISAQNHLQRLSGSNRLFVSLKHNKVQARLFLQRVFASALFITSPFFYSVATAPENSKNVIATYSNACSQKADEVDVFLLIPLNSDDITTPSSSRFVNYYAGILLGLDFLEEEGISVNLTVFDIEERGIDIQRILKEIEEKKPDLVIGPYQKEEIRQVAAVCKEQKIPVVSPWHTSSRLVSDNPYFIQMKPNLREHFQRLAESATAEFEKGEVAIIGVQSAEFANWVDYFQRKATEISGKENFFTPYTVPTDSLLKGPTAFFQFFKKNKAKAVLLPYYAYKDENLVYQALKRLSSEKGENQLSVFGMPILYESEKIEFDQYHTLMMRVVMSDFIDDRNLDIREFRRKYLDRFGEIPSNEAVKGYDLILFLGRNLHSFRDAFPGNVIGHPVSFIQSTYDLRESVSEEGLPDDDTSQFDFYENKHLEIIEFVDKRWQRK
jgi:hypothetical protein